jgi:hypothetical protein
MPWYFPSLRELVRIIPLAQSQTRGDTTLTLLSIDCYTDGWVINLRTHHADPHLVPIFNFHPKYDNRRSRQYGGSPGFGPWHYHSDDRNHFVSFLKHPALAPDPIPLEFFVPVVQFFDALPTEKHERSVLLLAEEWGPWHFTVDTTTCKTAEEQEPAEPSWKPIKEAEQAQRQARTVPRYGAVFEMLLAIFYKYDPGRIAWEDPAGATLYEKVTENIHRGLLYARSLADARAVIAFEWRDHWSKTVTEGPRFEAMVEESWQAWNRENDRGDSPTRSGA